jgi:hypothetical protein
MAARHRKFKKGGSVPIKDAGGNPYVKEEAEEKKHGGKAVGKMHGKMSKMRLDRPGRKRGGRVGADKSPLSSAHSSASADAAPHENSSE